MLAWSYAALRQRPRSYASTPSDLETHAEDLPGNVRKMQPGLLVSLANLNIYIKFVRLIPRRFLFKFINIRQRKHFNTKIASLSRRYLEERSAT